MWVQRLVNTHSYSERSNIKILEITNSPGYFISEYGDVYNSNGVKLKCFINDTGYKRIGLQSIKHNGKRVNQTIHLIVAAEFLKQGKYFEDTDLVIDHKDTNKLNNHYTNLELVTNTENNVRAHNKGLHTYNLRILLKDNKTKDTMYFRSLRELSRYLNCSLNYIRPRIAGSVLYPIDGRYTIKTNFKKYIEHISKKQRKTPVNIYVYDHINKKELVLTTYTSISIVLGIPELFVTRKFIKNNKNFYRGGYTFSNEKLLNFTNNISSEQALKDRNMIWNKIINECYVCKKRRAQASDNKS